MSLFGNKEEKNAQDAAAKAETDRLTSLPVVDLADELMGAFGPEGKKNPRGLMGAGETINLLQVLEWLLSDYPRSSKYWPQLDQPVREGLQVLEHADLISKTALPKGGVRMNATRLGVEALADGSVKQKLAPVAGS